MLSAVAAAGCTDAFRYSRQLPPISDRLRAAYPELRSGRFMVVADFERAEQAAMFTVAPPGSGASAPRITTLRARNDTGAGSLAMHFESALSAVLAADDPAAAWSLPRDWSAYQMLLMSIHSPRPIDTLRITIRGGKPGRFFVQDRLPLRPGWNLIQLDCRDMAGRLDLTDVRQIQWSFSRLDEPIVLHLDDLLLVDNTRQLWSSPDGEPGDLYVTHQARRLHVGAVGRFELIFRRGLIGAWYDLQNDPTRSANLASRGGMGPLPLLLPEVPRSQTSARYEIDLDPVNQWAVLGNTPRVRQVLEEVSALRAVIKAEWSWETAVADGASPEDQVRPADTTSLVWRYVVYPSGRVFVLVDCPTRTASWQADELALAVFGDGAAGFGSVETGGAEECEYGLLAQRGPAGADLLFVPHGGGGGRVASMRSANDARVGAMLHGLPVARPQQRWACLLVVWPGDLDAELTARSIATDYCEPGTLQVDCGQLILTDAGDLNNDGYNESEGVFVLAPQDKLLRFTCNRKGRLRFAPTIKLLETAGKDVWIYADGRIVRDVARTADGNVIARIAETIDRPVLVEVHCRDRMGDRGEVAGKGSDGT